MKPKISIVAEIPYNTISLFFLRDFALDNKTYTREHFQLRTYKNVDLKGKLPPSQKN